MLTVKFNEAMNFASTLHRAQVRKGTQVPYISHLLAVTALVIEDGGSEDEAIAALLHDGIEDQGKTFPGGRDGLRGYIADKFGGAVLDIVDACTDDEDVSPQQKNDPATWRTRKHKYLDHIPQISSAARRVSCADKLHNARCMLADYRQCRDELWHRFRTNSGSDQLWYYRALVTLFNAAEVGPLAKDLERVVAELERECAAGQTKVNA